MSGGRLKLGVIGARAIGRAQGGIETFCRAFYQQLPASKFDVTIFVSRPSSELPATHVKVLRAPTIRAMHLETVVSSCASVVLAWLLGIRTLHVHGISAALCLPLARFLGMRTVIRHMGPEYRRAKWGPVARRFLRLGEACVARYADAVVCISEDIAAQFTVATGRTRGISVIENAVGPPPADVVNIKRAALPLHPGEYVLAVGRLVPEKNFHVLADAFLRADFPEAVKLVIVGEFDYPGAYARRLRSLCARNERIVLAGPVYGAQLWDIYRQCGLYVLPSSYEGMSFSLLEALASGAKIIASDIPANARVCAGHARIVPANSVEALSEALRSEWRRERSPEDVRSQIEHCREKYGWAAVCRRMEPIFLHAAAALPLGAGG
jgi:glycosyltransferase involved in cell wall biosynthesis